MTEPTTAPLQSRATPVVKAGEGWRDVLRDAFPHNPHGIMPVAWSLAKSPFSTIFRLSDDPSYRAYWGLLLAITGITIVALFVTLPQAFNLLVGQEIISVAGDAQRLRLKFQLTQFAAVIVSTPLQYYAFRAVSPIARPPRAYVKMSVLGNCYNLLIRIAFGVLAVIAGLIIVNARAPVNPSTVIAIEFAMATLVNIAFAYELHRRYWQLSWWKTLLLTLFFVALSMYLIGPLLGVVVNSFDQLDSQVLIRR